MERSFEDISPILGIENDYILSRQGDVTIAYKAILPELFTLGDREYETFHQTWIKAIKILPKHSVFHKQDWFVESQYKADFNKELQFLSLSSERFFNERPFLEHECYIFITKRPAHHKPATSLLSTLICRGIVPKQSLSIESLNNFFDCCGQFERILCDSGFVQLKKLNGNDLTSTRIRPGIIEKYCFLHDHDGPPIVKDIMLRNELKIGDANCHLYTLADIDDLPTLCGPRINYDKYSTDKTKFSIGFASVFGQLLCCNHLYNQYVFLEDTSKTLKKLEGKRLRLQSLSAYSRANAAGKDAINDFLNEAITQQRQPVKAHFNLLVWTEDRDQLKEFRNLVSSACAQIDATPKQEVTGAPQIWWAGIPGNEGNFPMNDTFDTFIEQATCFLNLESNYRSSTSPFGLRLGDRLTGRPIHVDISDEPLSRGICTNRNKFILGPSGSGKSFFTNHMVRSYYEQGAHIVLLDVGNSYKGLCDLVGGYYFMYHENNPISFNPFYVDDHDSLDTEKKESIKTLLLALWKKNDEPYTRSEYVSLSNALQLYFEKIETYKDIIPCFNSFYEFIRDDFTCVLKDQQVKEKDFDISNFLYVLRPFYKNGELNDLLNATENLDLLNERFIVFELDNIKDHPILFPVVTIIIMDVFISKMRKLKGVRKMILIEEAWKAIAKEGMAEYIKYLFKTVRKFFGEAVVVTQDIDDIISSPIVKQTVINNSDCKILLDQSKYQNKFDQIQDLLGLTDKEKVLVMSLNKKNDPLKNYKEVFISLGGTVSRVYRTEVSQEEYLAYTTEEKEKVRVMTYANKHGGIQEGITALIKDLRGKG